MRSIHFILLLVTGIAFAWMSEEGIFNRYGDRIFRPNKTTLCIITSQGDTVSFIDTEYDEYSDFFEEFSVISCFPEQNYWVLHIYGYEWQEWQLVSGYNGNVYVTISEPILSPDSSRFLCMMDDIDATFIVNGIDIWRIDEDSLVLEFSDRDVPWGPVYPDWVTDSLIEFEKMNHDPEGYVFRPGSIELDDTGTWIPDDPSDWTWD